MRAVFSALPMRTSVALALGLTALPLIAVAPASAQTYGTDQNYCDRSLLEKMTSTSTGNLVGTAAGAALGGLLGSQMGGGTGKTALTIVGVLGGALAGGYIGRSMDTTDQQCVGQTLEHTPANQTVAWNNQQNGSSYWVTPTGDFQGQNGQPCRNYVTQAVVNGQTQRSNGTACRNANGAWVPASTNGATQPAPSPRTSASAVPQDTVFQVQQKLHDRGFYVTSNIDGRWGPKTVTALQNFQRANRLNPTGQLDASTMNELGIKSE